jgi:hypothetical protein
VPRVEITGARKQQHLSVLRNLTYHGFTLESLTEDLRGDAPAELLPAVRDALTDALMAGATVHPDQGRVRRALEEASELWRRSGGTLVALRSEAIRRAIRDQLETVSGWDSFLATRLRLDLSQWLDPEVRQRLASLPSSIRLLGDAAPITYEAGPQGASVRLHLREGQARRLGPDDLPTFDRRLTFAVNRGSLPGVQADTFEELQAALRGLRGASKKEKRRFQSPPRRRRR